MSDKINLINPDYYKSDNNFEVIDVIAEFTKDLNGVLASDTANIIKYACRWPNKDGINDVRKIIWYAEDLLERLENSNKITDDEKCHNDITWNEIEHILSKLNVDIK